jgi:hypothetical protein
MTREEIKEMLPILVAFTEGKTIQSRCLGDMFGKYTECLLCNLVKSGQPVTIVGNKFDKEK